VTFQFVLSQCLLGDRLYSEHRSLVVFSPYLYIFTRSPLETFGSANVSSYTGRLIVNSLQLKEMPLVIVAPSGDGVCSDVISQLA
jgi:hypothetical protein